MKNNWIGLLDCNNFFVSCERLFRPDLAKKPVIVLSSNDGCVVARSQEVKDMGVPMGVPYFKIKDKLQEVKATVFSSHFALYRDISRRVFSVMRAELGVVEQYSIDEAFFVLQDKSLNRLVQIKTAVERQVGVPVSLGLAATKTQAKYANYIAKQGSGACLLDADSWNVLTPTIPLSDVWGVGRGLELRFKQHGLCTVQDLLNAPSDRISALYGIGGRRVQEELRGVPVLPFTAQNAAKKSLTSSASFSKSTTDYNVLQDALAYHVRSVAANLRVSALKTKAIKIFIRPSRYSDFVLRGGLREAVLPAPTNDTFVLLRAAKALLKELYEPGVPYQKLGVVLSTASDNVTQKSLFQIDSIEQSQPQIMSIVDKINASFGCEAVLIGAHLHTSSWRVKAATRSPAYTTRWSDLQSVSA